MRADQYYTKGTHGYMDLKDDLFAMYIFEQIEKHVSSLKPYAGMAWEVGSGMGRFSSEIVKRYRQVDLIEPSNDYYLELKDKFTRQNGDVFVHNQTSTEYISEKELPEHTTGFVFHVLHHMDRKSRVELFTFVSDRKARAVFVEPNPWNPLIFIQIILHPNMTFKEEKAYLSLTRKKVVKELGDAGIYRFVHKKICFLPPFVCEFLLRKKLKWALVFFDSFCQILPFMPSYQLLFCDTGEP